MTEAWLAIGLLTPVLVVLGMFVKRSRPIAALWLSGLSGLALVGWTVVTGRASFFEFASLSMHHRFTAYLVGCYSVFLASMFVLMIRYLRKRSLADDEPYGDK